MPLFLESYTLVWQHETSDNTASRAEVNRVDVPELGDEKDGILCD